MQTPAILVTGAAGKLGAVGFKIVELLRAQNIAVRAMVRTLDTRATALSDLGAEVVVGDLTDLADVHRVMQGCDRVYFGMSVSDSYLEATLNTAAVAKHHKVTAFVNISQMTVSQMNINATTPSVQQKYHWLSEQALNWSGLPVVHLRATVFLEHFFFCAWAAESIARASELRAPFGDARTSPIATLDVARSAATILLAPKEHIGKVYELTGPKSQSMREIAAAYAEALGKPVNYVDLPFSQWEKTVLDAKHLPPHVHNHIGAMALLHSQGRYDRLTHDVEGVTGSKPMSVGDWVRANRALFS